MSDLPLELYKVKQIRELEQLAIKQFKISEADLMRRAGLAAYQTLQAQFDPVERITVICGKGNNGGDGYVLAKLAYADEVDVVVYHLGELTDLPKVAKQMADECIAAGINVEPFPNEPDFDVDVIVDALLGIGIIGTVKSPAKEVIDAINMAAVPVLAIDVPSGLNADTGMLCDDAVDADATITFIGIKQGLITGEACEYCGDLQCTDLDIPEAAFNAVPMTAYRLELEDVQTVFVPRERYAHKGDFGHVLVIGGDYGMAGAVRMAGEAAARMGAGLTTVATRPEHVAAVVSARPEIMCWGIEKPLQIKPLLECATVVVLGPGLGQSDWSKALFKKVLASDLPLVVDASALHLLAHTHQQRDNWVLTPHPGEAASLLKTTSDEIQSDRFNAALQLQKRYGGVMVLKGAGTIVQAGDTMPEVCDAGNPGMASGGMGDILSGMVAGLIAQDFSVHHAASAAVCLHAAAADIASEQGERGMLATDVLSQLRELINPYQFEPESSPTTLQDLLSQANVDSFNDEE